MSRGETPLPALFDALGLPVRLTVEPALVTRRYFERSRELHPDYHGHLDPEALRALESRAALVNLAARVLKDPVRLAEALLDHLDPGTRDQGGRAERIPPDLAETWFEIHEWLDDWRADPAMRADLGPRIDAARADIARRLAERVAGMREVFAAFDRESGAGGPSEAVRRELAARLRTAVERHRYLSTLARDIDRARGA